MSVQQVAEQLMQKYCGTDELVKAGGFKVAQHQELTNIVMNMHRYGPRAGSERVRLKVFSDSDYSKLYATSAWVRLSDIEDGTGLGWRGRVRFDFESPNLNKNRRYYLGIETDNYTRDRNTFYLAFFYDWPEPIYTQLDAAEGRYGLEMSIWGRRSL